MNKGILFLAVLGGFLLFTQSSCCKKKVYCSSETLDFAFTGFERYEVRSFVLRRYPIDGQWGKPLDSSVFVYNGPTAVSPNEPDTVYFSDYQTVGVLRGITPGNDWGIYFPNTGKVYFVTTVLENDKRSELASCSDKSASCKKDITGASVNSSWVNGNFAFIQKSQ